MDGKQLRDDLLRKLYLQDAASAPLEIKDDVTTAINRAFQDIWTQAPDHFRRQKLTLTTVAAQDSYGLPQNVQEILGPVRIDRAFLALITNKGDILAFNTRFQGDLTVGSGSGQPQAYFLERLFQSHTVEDNTTINMILAPTPDQAYTVEYECSTEAPIFERTDWCDTPAPVLPIPHKYVESILAPIARFFLMDSHYFTDFERSAMFKDGYLRALRTLGVSDPQVPPLANPKIERPNDDR